MASPEQQKRPTCEESVLEWLNKTGFPLEMKAAAAFRAGGFAVKQAVTYPDPVMEKGREIDVWALDENLGGFVEIGIAVECKATTKPWVVLTTDDLTTAPGLVPTSAVFTDRALGAMVSRGLHLAKVDLNNRLESERVFPQGTSHGYGLRQAHEDPKRDAGNDAALGVLSACRGMFAQDVAGHPDMAGVALPLIVVNAPIFECRLQHNGDLKLLPVQESAFVVHARIPDSVITRVRIAHISAIDKVVGSYRTIVDAFRRDLIDEECRQSERYKARFRGA